MVKIFFTILFLGIAVLVYIQFSEDPYEQSVDELIETRKIVPPNTSAEKPKLKDFVAPLDSVNLNDKTPEELKAYAEAVRQKHMKLIENGKGDADKDYPYVSMTTLGDFLISYPNHKMAMLDDGLVPSTLNETEFYNNQVPLWIKEYNGKKVTIRGYFYPIEKNRKGIAVRFLLMKFLPSCCFNDVLVMNELILVEAPNNEEFFDPDDLLEVKGILDVGHLKIGSVDIMYRLVSKKIGLLHKGI